MLKTRLMSAGIGLILLAAIVFADRIVLGLVVTALAGVAITEFFDASKQGGFKPLRAAGYAALVPLVFIALDGTYPVFAGFIDAFKTLDHFSVFIYLLILLLMAAPVFRHDRYRIEDVAVTLFGIVYVVFLLAFLILVRNKPGRLDVVPRSPQDVGFWLMWLVFIGAWITDVFAYFGGRLFGRRKIVPAISPNKTVEGSIAGFLGCVGVTIGYGALLHGSGILADVRMLDFAVIGVTCGLLAQWGDWMASAVKRYMKIKDFGTLMPGHGGALDRFDSILVIAPFVYFYASFILRK